MFNMFTYNTYIHTYVHATNSMITYISMYGPCCRFNLHACILNLKRHVGFDLRALHACMPDVHACMQCFACFALCVYITLYKADAHCHQHFVCNG